MELQPKLVQKQIRREDHIIHVLPAQTWLIPTCNLDHYSGIGLQHIEFSTDTLSKFLRLPFVVDDFEDHEERRRWRLSRRSRGLDVIDVKENALRCNAMVGVDYAALLVDRIYAGPQRNGVHEAVLGVRKHTPVYSGSPAIRPYDKLSTSDKISFVKELKGDVFELLKALSR